MGLLDNKVICTGALVIENDKTARIVRMSVKKHFRRQGFAEQLLKTLERKANELGVSRLVLEINRDWKSAVQFYLKMGFIEEKEEKDWKHFIKWLC